MASQQTEISRRILIGPAGWSYADWQGVVYPGPPKAGFSPLAYLLTFFPTVEINSTFYRIPSTKVTTKWAEIAEKRPDFVFCVKAWQGMTHGDFPPDEHQIEAFVTALQPLVEHQKLGAVLVQYPWRHKFTPSNLDAFQRLRDRLQRVPVAVEFRHNSWNTDRVLNALKESRTGFVNIDQPIIGDSLPPTGHVTADFAYFRFHGRNTPDWFRQDAGRDQRYNYLYTQVEIDSWLNPVFKCAEKTATVFVVFNNHFKGQAVVNSLQMIARFVRKPIAVPETLANFYPQLRSIAASLPDEQTSFYF
ncbi:DUF72 domain-containing protein [candidate division KSB1 bacterium]|nr:DUF72 domain-containing protein [candidate division KSB1 bacterium]